MRTPVVVGVVVGIHCLVIGSIFCLQGCKLTPKAPSAQPPVAAMPPTVQAPAPAAPAPTPMPPPVPVFQPSAPVEPVAKAVGTKTYVVTKGDSIGLIAKRFKVSQKEIMELNGIKNASKIRVGQKLSLPAYVNLSAPRPVQKHKTVARAAKAGGGEYAVKAGDSLSAIAHANGTSVKAIREANNLSSDKIRIGQKLAMPGAVAKAGEGETKVLTAEPKPEAMEAPSSSEEASAAAPVAGAAEGGSASFSHVIEANQDLNEVAMIYGVSVDELMRVNTLTNSTVRVGQRLKIPAASR
jgi:LysM repeat protein